MQTMRAATASVMALLLLSGAGAGASTPVASKPPKKPSSPVDHRVQRKSLIGRVKQPKPASQMTLAELERFQTKALAHYTGMWNTWLTVVEPHYRTLEAFPSSPQWRMKNCRGAVAPTWACWNLEARAWTKANLLKTRAKIEYLRQWNWQAFPSWIIRLAVCESGGSGGQPSGFPNWWATATSRDGSFYSAFNIGRSRYDAVAHHMGVRGWNEGPGIPSPYEQAMAVIGYARTVGDGFAGHCRGIVRSSWN